MVSGGGSRGQHSAHMTRETLQQHKENLLHCVDFCTNEEECRRVLVLKYFGENFDRTQCAGTCDNCIAATAGEVTRVDCTAHAQRIVALTRIITENPGRFPSLTLAKLAKLYMGSKVSSE